MTSRLATAALLLAPALLLSACGGGTDAADAAHTRACRTYLVLGGDRAQQASDAFAHAAGTASYNPDRLVALLGPLDAASLKAALVDDLSDADFATFHALHTAVADAEALLANHSGLLPGDKVSALSDAVASAGKACG